MVTGKRGRTSSFGMGHNFSDISLPIKKQFPSQQPSHYVCISGRRSGQKHDYDQSGGLALVGWTTTWEYV